MREEDKVLLICDLLKVDVTAYLDRYIEELRTSKIYLQVCAQIIKLRKHDYFRNIEIIRRFEVIDFSKIKTFLDFEKTYAEILDIALECQKEKMINPLLSEEKMTLGEVMIPFDGRDITFNDMLLDERYTKTYKINQVKEIYLNYRKEVKTLLISPFVEFLRKEDVIDENIKEKSTIAALLSSVILANIIIIILPLFPVTTLRNIYSGTIDSEVVMVTFYVLIVILFLLDLVSIFFYNVYLNKFRIFIRAYNSLRSEKSIMVKINNKSEAFYYLLLRHIDEIKPLNIPLNKVSLIDVEMKNLLYLIEIKDKLNAQYPDLLSKYGQELNVQGELTSSTSRLIAQYIKLAEVQKLVAQQQAAEAKYNSAVSNKWYWNENSEPARQNRIKAYKEYTAAIDSTTEALRTLIGQEGAAAKVIKGGKGLSDYSLAPSTGGLGGSDKKGREKRERNLQNAESGRKRKATERDFRKIFPGIPPDLSFASSPGACAQTASRISPSTSRWAG